MGRLRAPRVLGLTRRTSRSLAEYTAFRERLRKHVPVVVRSDLRGRDRDWWGLVGTGRPRPHPPSAARPPLGRWAGRPPQARSTTLDTIRPRMGGCLLSIRWLLVRLTDSRPGRTDGRGAVALTRMSGVGSGRITSLGPGRTLEATTAGMDRDYPKLQILSIRELLEEHRKPALPPLVLPTFQPAERVKARGGSR